MPSDSSQPTLLEEAKRHHGRGEMEQAMRLYEKVLKNHPSDPGILHLTGVAAIELGRFSQAIDHISRAIAYAPGQPVLLNSLGVALMGTGRLDAAYARFQDVIRLDPEHLEAHCHLARLLLRQKKAREAVPFCQKAIQLAPAHADANALLASALRMAHSAIMASYYQRLAEYYGGASYAQDETPRHTVFTDRHKAWQTAQQANRIPETVSVSGLQLCYYIGETLDDPPANLIQIPIEQKGCVAFFLSTRFSWPTDIDFDPAQIPARNVAFYMVKTLSEAWIARMREIDRLTQVCRRQQPRFVAGERMRVWLVASRKTTVMQYNARDLAQGFRKQGCEVSFLLESDERESLTPYHYQQDRLAFNPHITVHINHLNSEGLHDDVFNVTWWQDLMESIAAEQPLPWRKRDLIYSINQELDESLYQCGAAQVQRQGFCYDGTLFQDFGKPRKRKIVVIASSYHTFIPKDPRMRRLVADFEAMFEAGEAMTHAALDRVSKDSPISKKDTLFFLWGYVVRDMSVRWLCTLADEIEVEVYGRHWEQDARVRPFFKGPLPHGPAVAEVYNGAKYALVPHLFDLQSQRLMEATACGCLPVVYDCRYRAEKPHWDDQCLWYRTQAEMRACITQEPLSSPQEICRGKSYRDFAARILAEVSSRQLRGM